MSLAKKLIIGLAIAMAGVLAVVLLSSRVVVAPSLKKPPTVVAPASSLIPQPTAAISFNKQQFSLDDPTSLWVVVNKARALVPQDYLPTDLVVPNVPLRIPGNETMQVRAATAQALELMFTAAKQQNINLMVSSGYRSHSYQVGLYGGYVTQKGQAAADQSSARPGHSEHQTGLAVDLEPVTKECEVSQCFADTIEGQWLAVNAYKYGFLIRYPSDKVPITGYQYEPWHVRYVGTDLSTELHNKNIETLEEFFGLPAAPDYL